MAEVDPRRSSSTRVSNQPLPHQGLMPCSSAGWRRVGLRMQHRHIPRMYFDTSSGCRSKWGLLCASPDALALRSSCHISSRSVCSSSPANGLSSVVWRCMSVGRFCRNLERDIACGGRAGTNSCCVLPRRRCLGACLHTNRRISRCWETQPSFALSTQAVFRLGRVRTRRPLG